MNIHTSISTLSIFAYNQIGKTHDLNNLIIDRTKKVDRASLESSWAGIVAQYLDAISHRESMQEVIELQKIILEITITYNNIKTLIFCCKHCFEQDVIDELNYYGYDVKRKKDLLTVDRQSRSLLTELREKEFELSQHLVKPAKNTTFEQSLNRINVHNKLTTNPRETTCLEWIAIEDNYIEDMKRIK